MDSTPEDAPVAQNPATASAFAQSVVNDPEGALHVFQNMQTQINNLEARVATMTTPSSSETSDPPPPSNPAPSPPAFDPAYLATIIAQAIAQANQNQPPVVQSTPAPAPLSRLSEKLPDIAEYDGDRDKLDAWEQALKQKMHTNHDRYSTDALKISYAESRLTIGKRAHTLMSPYRTDGICTILAFATYLRTLRNACGNPFEAEDARVYLRNTLKQDKMTFPEYHLIFVAKKERANMDDDALIECLKNGVNFATQQAAITWRNANGKRPVTYEDYVECFTDVDKDLQHLKHNHPRATPAAPASKSKPSVPTNTKSTSAPVPVVAAVPLAAGDPMDLDSAMAAVKGKSLATPGVREICNKWHLCYYCKSFHEGKTAKDCPNKKKSFNLRVVEIDDAASIDGGVPVSSGKV